MAMQLNKLNPGCAIKLVVTSCILESALETACPGHFELALRAALAFGLGPQNWGGRGPHQI